MSKQFFLFLDIKPELLDLEPPMSPVAGPSHSADENSMMYMDQSNMSSMSGPSSYQDNSALVPTDSQQQGNYRFLLEREQKSEDRFLILSCFVLLIKCLYSNMSCIWYNSAFPMLKFAKTC